MSEESDCRLHSWLRTECFQRPPTEAIDLATGAWDKQQERIDQLEKALEGRRKEAAYKHGRILTLEKTAQAAYIGWKEGNDVFGPMQALKDLLDNKE